MPITGQGWELLVKRAREDTRNGKRRTVGSYQVFHNGKPVAGLAGAIAETKGPGDNSTPGNNRCVEASTYPLNTQDGAKYVTLGFKDTTSITIIPRPGIELGKTGKRSEILIHPGKGFLSSVGCINPCKGLANANSDIDFLDSRKRTIAIIDDMKAFLGAGFPTRNRKAIPNATIVIEAK
ncbi:MAG: hypothetical protein ABI399_04515 [Bauldia sp.]